MKPHRCLKKHGVCRVGCIRASGTNGVPSAFAPTVRAGVLSKTSYGTVSASGALVFVLYLVDSTVCIMVKALRGLLRARLCFGHVLNFDHALPAADVEVAVVILVS